MNKEALLRLKLLPDVAAACLDEVMITGEVAFRVPTLVRDLRELTDIYRTVFNMNNQDVLATHDIPPVSSAVGQPLWDEEKWTPAKAEDVIKSYLDGSNLASVAYAPTEQGERILAFNLIRPKTEKFLTDPVEAKKIPHSPLPGDAFYSVSDTFKLPHVVTVAGERVRDIGRAIRNFGVQQVMEHAQGAQRVIIYSTTTNPAMVKIWDESGWERFIDPDDKAKSAKYPRYRGFKVYQR